jgi:predicted alpha/beta hydrolase family esterase
MKQVILIHGTPDKEEYFGDRYPSPSNFQWIPWTQKELNKKDIISQALEMPHPFDPVYTEYCEVFNQMKIDNQTVLVGHSSGAGFLLRYFSEHSELKPNKIILVAPWIDPEKEFDKGFFDFEIDQNLVGRTELHIFMSSDDEDQLSSFKIVKEKLPNAIYHEFNDRGHFLTVEFPELLEIL